MKVNPSRLNGVRIRSRGYLPHWLIDDAIYFVTYRLADSLPAAIVQSLQEEQRKIRGLICGDEDPSLQQRLEISRLFARSLDSALDRGMGRCDLADPRIAEVVAKNLRFHDGNDHHLLCWCVMPNHVHVLLKVDHGPRLSQIVQRWKSFTAKRANRILGRSRTFWQPEYFDRIVRSQDDLLETTEYVLANPDRAGLANWAWRWPQLISER